MKNALQAKLIFGLVPVGILILVFARPSRLLCDDQDARKSVDAFNQTFIEACQKMNHPAAAALWAEDGADLLPGMAPMVGKAKISEWLNGLTPQLAGAKMVYCTVDWQDIQIHGDLAYESSEDRFPTAKEVLPERRENRPDPQTPERRLLENCSGVLERQSTSTRESLSNITVRPTRRRLMSCLVLLARGLRASRQRNDPASHRQIRV